MLSIVSIVCTFLLPLSALTTVSYCWRWEDTWHERAALVQYRLFNVLKNLLLNG